MVSHAKQTIFQMAEVAVPEKLFRSMLSRIHRLGRGLRESTCLEFVNAAIVVRWSKTRDNCHSSRETLEAWR